MRREKSEEGMKQLMILSASSCSLMVWAVLWDGQGQMLQTWEDYVSQR